MVVCTKGMWVTPKGNEKVYPYETGRNTMNDFYSRYRYQPMFVNRAKACPLYLEWREDEQINDFISCINCGHCRLGERRVIRIEDIIV